jgi:hypothetical protein
MSDWMAWTSLGFSKQRMGIESWADYSREFKIYDVTNSITDASQFQVKNEAKYFDYCDKCLKLFNNFTNS